MVIYVSGLSIQKPQPAEAADINLVEFAAGFKLVSRLWRDHPHNHFILVGNQ